MIASVLLATLPGCGKVDNPTAKGTVLVEWDRSSARLHDGNDPTKAGPAHPVATAKIVEGPKTLTYGVELADAEDKKFSFDVVVGAAKVSEEREGKVHERWATTSFKATLTSNEAFRIEGKCDDRIASAMGAIGEVTNTMMSCRVVAKRPNMMGNEDAITSAVSMQIEGSGKLLVADRSAKVVEK